LFSLYKAELTLRIHNIRNLSRYHQVLDQFQEFLADNPPSSILAKSFLSKWSKQKPATLYKYLSIIKGFLKWYGDEIDLKVKLPHQLPEYVEDESIQKLIRAIKNKQTHKKTIDRDILLIKLAYNSGLRREELSNLKVSDILINEKILTVRKGKGMKDRTVPLPSRIMKLLERHIADMNPDDSIFNVKSVAISDKIRRIAKNAGVNIHAHSLRHGYATRLLEKGANIKAVQELLGHSRIGTTEAYLSLLPKHLREAVDLLDDEKEKGNYKKDPTFIEAKGKHLKELCRLVAECKEQLKPPSQLPDIAKSWLTDKIPREILYEMLEQPDTTKLFVDALEQQQPAQPFPGDYYLPFESDPLFANLCQHLKDTPVIGSYESFKKKYAELLLDYGAVHGAIVLIIKTGILRQHYGQQLTTLSGYEEMVKIASGSETSAAIIGIVLSCDLLAHGLSELNPKPFGATFAVSLRKTRVTMALALGVKVPKSSQFYSDLTDLGKILWEDKDDPMQVKTRVQKILHSVGRLQQLYEELQTGFQFLLSKDPFPGKCLACPDY
jgi:integrase/recombinase XerD